MKRNTLLLAVAAVAALLSGCADRSAAQGWTVDRHGGQVTVTVTDCGDGRQVEVAGRTVGAARAAGRIGPSPQSITLPDVGGGVTVTVCDAAPVHLTV